MRTTWFRTGVSSLSPSQGVALAEFFRTYRSQAETDSWTPASQGSPNLSGKDLAYPSPLLLAPRALVAQAHLRGH